MSNLRVLVVGASIAGPTAAYWFAKAGASVTVIERFPDLRTNGQNVDIRSVGVTVMRRMSGMEPAVLSKIVPIHGISLVRSDGKPYGSIKPTGNSDQQSLVSEYEVYRGDLARILYDMTKDQEKIRYVFGEQVTAIKKKNVDENGPVTVEFANGHPTTEFDLVVAADGATSRTRALALARGVRDHMHPVNAWAAFFTIPQKDLLNGSPLGHVYTAVGGRFIAIAPDCKAAGNRVTLMGIYPQSSPEMMTPFREVLATGDQAVKRFIADQFTGAGWVTDAIMDAMLNPSSSTEFYATEMVQLKPPCLYKGRVVLVGDAGYASGPTGMGTSLAIAGAYILAGEISNSAGNIEAGLKAYEERMRMIVNDMGKIPPLIPRVLAPYTAWGLWLRNTVFAVLCRTGMLEMAQRWSGAEAFAPHGGRDDDVRFPLYNFGEDQ